MGVLNIYHPDIEIFINEKASDANKLNHFNISVMVDDDFMKAVQEDKTITLHWPVYDEKGRILKDKEKWKVTKEINAKYLWDEIIKKAYDNGEPGIFFYDNMNKDNNLWYEESIVCSNPCAEYLAGTVYGGDLPSSQYGGACNLGSLMLHKFVENPFEENAQINFSKLQKTIQTAVRMLDNIIDINTFPDDIYKNYQQRYRTIGLGYTGLADALVMLNLKYNSQKARDFVSYLTDYIALCAYMASIDLAKEKGSFPGFKANDFIKSGFIKKHTVDSNFKEDWDWVVKNIKDHGIRNAKLLSVAPTGTMSMVFGNNCSSGIEPIFSLSYTRKIKMGGQDDSNIKEFEIQDYAYYMYQKWKKNQSVTKEPPFVTALEMTVDDHIDMLSCIAYNVDMSVSKTINVPTDYSFEDCKSIYTKCWENNIKGCTIFRPNEIRQGILSTNSTQNAKKKENNKHELIELQRGDIICCDDSLIGIKKKLTTGCGTMHLMAWYDPISGDIMETFVGRGSSGGCEKNLTAMARLISSNLRGGIPLSFVIDQLESCGGCSAYQVRRATHKDTSPGSSCATAIAKALQEMQQSIYEDLMIDQQDATEVPKGRKIAQGQYNNTKKEDDSSPKCPECGQPISFEGGCNICKSCGWSKCG